jgi:DeoR/GlpR family transcriptional regulator of sugar metabolism
VRVAELSRRYGVTQETIRRDLDKLAREGLVTKSYGGAVFNEDIHSELPIYIRVKKNISAKRAIAHIITGLVKDGDIVFLDASSTVLMALKALKRLERRITVITNSVENIVELTDCAEIETYSTGGKLLLNYLAFIGPKTVNSVREYNADIAILSCRGIDRKRYITDSDDSMAETKLCMMKYARTTILAADRSKFDKVAMSKITDFSGIDYIVTDVRPSAEWLAFFDERGIQCLYP